MLIHQTAFQSPISGCVKLLLLVISDSYFLLYQILLYQFPVLYQIPFYSIPLYQFPHFAFHVWPLSSFPFYHILLYLIPLYQLPLSRYIRFCYNWFHYINFHVLVIWYSVLSESVISHSIFWLYHIPFYQNPLYQFPLLFYQIPLYQIPIPLYQIRTICFRYIKVRYIKRTIPIPGLHDLWLLCLLGLIPMQSRVHSFAHVVSYYYIVPTHGQRVGLALPLIDLPKVLALRSIPVHQVATHVVVDLAWNGIFLIFKSSWGDVRDHAYMTSDLGEECPTEIESDPSENPWQRMSVTKKGPKWSPRDGVRLQIWNGRRDTLKKDAIWGTFLELSTSALI